jgi:class 3 adenylate cyclase
VFFSDVVGFTDLCAVMPPAKVMAMLDRLYHAFDLLTAQHGVYKASADACV